MAGINSISAMNSLLSSYSSAMKLGNVSGAMTARNISKAMANISKGNLESGSSNSNVQFSKNAQKFYNGMYARTDAMSIQAENLSKTEFKVDKLAEDGSNATAVQAQTDALYSKVKSFADSVNNTTSFLRTNSGKSPVIKSMAASYNKTLSDDAADLAKIGISFSSSGNIQVDKSAFSKAMQDSPDTVNQLLGGSNGMGAKAAAEGKSTVNISKTILPQVSSAFSAFTTGSTYSGKGQASMLRYSTGIGLILNQLV